MRPNQVHYLLPTLAITAVALLVFVLREQKPLHRLARMSGRLLPAIMPRLLAATTFLAGTILLFSGATPAVGQRLGWLHNFLPLPVIEVSHFFGSLAGAGLLVLSRGLQRRLDAAYHVSIILLGAGIIFSLLKAFDYEEAAILSVMLIALIPSHRFFYRKARLLEERFTPRWIVAIALVVAGSVVLGLLSYREPGMAGGRIWDFSLHAQAPRFMRATVGVLVLLVVVAGERLFRPARPAVVLPSPDDLAAAAASVAQSPEAGAHLALLGDKLLLFDDARTAFVMYGIAGRSWVSLGDPVGPRDAVPGLVKRFIEESDRHGAWPVFYRIGRDHLSLYLDLGFSVVKLGEEARVSLETFSLDGPERRNLRRVHRKIEQEGCAAEVVEGDALRAHLGTLRAISDAWLEAKKTREKRFSLGWFEERYVLRYPTALVRCGGTVVAFANAWPSGAQEELEVDLMRFLPTAPPGIMRYALVELMLWGKARGYRWFNLGMAPLSGIPSSALRTLWNQIGSVVYGRGERFYNFQGIRDFKDWFRPVWEPRYLASPGGAMRPVILANIASLIAGGLEGVVRR